MLTLAIVQLSLKHNTSRQAKMQCVCSLQMAGEPAEPTGLGVEEGKSVGDETDAKPDRRGRFLLFGRWLPFQLIQCICERETHTVHPWGGNSHKELNSPQIHLWPYERLCMCYCSFHFHYYSHSVWELRHFSTGMSYSTTKGCLSNCHLRPVYVWLLICCWFLLVLAICSNFFVWHC